MANVLRLANADQSETIDLMSGTLKLADQGWTTSSTRQVGTYAYSTYGAVWEFSNYDPVIETFELIGDDTDANLRTAFGEIADVLDRARRFHIKPLSTVTSAAGGPESWWLEWNIDGEPAKRALIYEGSMDVLQGCGHSPFLQQDAVLARLSLLRHPFWEEISPTDDSASIGICFGATDTITDVPGDVPARIQYAAVGPFITDDFTKVWMGIREKGVGYDDFESVWECEDGTNYNGASDAVDATASGGDKVQKASPAATLTQYWSMTVEQACTAGGHNSYAHQYGSYLILLRCKVDSGTVGLQLHYGYSSGDTIPAEEVFITNTAWQLVELGNVQIPPSALESLMDSSYAQETMISIYAEQVSGTSTLDLDAICLIPTSHFASATDADLKYYGMNAGAVRFYTQPNDDQGGYGLLAGVPNIGVKATLQDFYLPAGNSIVVWAATDDTSHDLSEQLSIGFRYFPRYMLYRYTGGT